MTQPVCLILGAGIVGNVAKRFAPEGCHACLARRRDKAGRDRLVAKIRASGGSASGHRINVIEDDSTENLVTDIETQVGAIEFAVCNLGARIGDWGLADTSLKAFEMGWRTAVDAHRKLAHFWTGV